MKTIKICDTCKHYKGNRPNNCAINMVHTIQIGDSACYKHTDVYKNENNN